MNLFDDNPDLPPEAQPPAGDPFTPGTAPHSAAPELVLGDPFALANAGATTVIPYFRGTALPEDLRISWSWPHLLTFVFFGFASLIVIQLVMAVYMTAGRHLSAKQLQQALESNPQFIVGSNVLWFAFLLL